MRAVLCVDIARTTSSLIRTSRFLASSDHGVADDQPTSQNTGFDSTFFPQL